MFSVGQPPLDQRDLGVQDKVAEGTEVLPMAAAARIDTTKEENTAEEKLAAGAAQPSSSSLSEEEEEEEEICRVCRGPQEEDRPLYTPCLCSGSISHVHQDCLMTWLEYANKDTCELCNHKFVLTPMFASNTPAALSPFEVLGMMGWKALQCLPFVLRVVLALTAWIVGVPVFTWYVHVLLATSVHDSDPLSLCLTLCSARRSCTHAN